jgi:hypothetical protein
VGWLTASRFFRGEILAGDFFLHALVTVAIIMLLTFFLLQGLVRLSAGQRRLLAKAFERLQARADKAHILMAGPLADQVRLVLRLAGDRKTGTDVAANGIWKETISGKRPDHPSKPG